MNKKINDFKAKILKFYEKHEKEVKKAVVCISCLFLGYLKGKSDSLDKLSDINFVFRIKDAGESFSS